MVYFDVIGAGYGACNYPDFLTGWFELIGELLEPEGQGENYPVFFGDFYDGEVDHNKLPQLLVEVKKIWEVLKNIPVNFDRIYNDPCFRNVPDLDNQIKRDAKTYGDVFLNMYTHEDFFHGICVIIGSAIRKESNLEIRNRIGPNGI